MANLLGKFQNPVWSLFIDSGVTPARLVLDSLLVNSVIDRVSIVKDTATDIQVTNLPVIRDVSSRYEQYQVGWLVV